MGLTLCKFCFFRFAQLIIEIIERKPDFLHIAECVVIDLYRPECAVIFTVHRVSYGGKILLSFPRKERPCCPFPAFTLWPPSV